MTLIREDKIEQSLDPTYVRSLIMEIAQDWQSILNDTSADRSLALVRRCPFCSTVLAQNDAVCPGCLEGLDGAVGLPPSYMMYLIEALDLHVAGEPDAAMEAVRLSLRLHPSNLPARRLAARLAGLSGDWTEARRHIAVARSLAPDDEATHHLANAIALGESARDAIMPAPMAGQVESSPRVETQSGGVSSNDPNPVDGRVTIHGLALGGLAGAAVAALAALIARGRRHGKRRS
jgi:tetratricopeptide (TPR) repeat protein